MDELFYYRLGQKRGGGSGGGVTIKNQNKTITANGTYKADSGYTGLGTVNVNVPASGITPSGTLNITANGNYDVTNYAGASVNVAASGGGGDSELEETLISVIERTTTDPVLPSGLTSIGEYAFYKCTKLALPSLPGGLTSIGEYAFGNCLNLAITSLPSGVTSIGDYAFGYCSKLAITSLPSGLTSIGASVFRGCSKLAITSLPSGVTSIGNNAFYDCKELTEITFEGKPTTINSGAFKNCTNLKIINVPWAEGAVASAPWGATNATINYNYTGG